MPQTSSSPRIKGSGLCLATLWHPQLVSSIPLLALPLCDTCVLCPHPKHTTLNTFIHSSGSSSVLKAVHQLGIRSGRISQRHQRVLGSEAGETECRAWLRGQTAWGSSSRPVPLGTGFSIFFSLWVARGEKLKQFSLIILIGFVFNFKIGQLLHSIK